MFFGRYDCTIDAKGRLNFPAKFRDGMGDSFVVMEWLDQCLFALPMSEVERISERMGADELMDSWEITGDLFSTACEVTLDKQGRILLPASLRQYAGLGKTVAVIGLRSGTPPAGTPAGPPSPTNSGPPVCGNCTSDTAAEGAQDAACGDEKNRAS